MSKGSKTIVIDTRTIVDEEELARLRAINNPNNEPSGAYTGRCNKCGSTDIWTDDPNYWGCNVCGYVEVGGSAKVMCPQCNQWVEMDSTHRCIATEHVNVV